ncbi:carboxymuconolactone decarboxylase family protein [Alkalimonas mucilaginosa]|uniref:Carboxymuconolactone decarboxylase family protein n=1 Tax=Alkalimonas mucilaginosa TaxID=3057676 RepID=A0ABU7JDI1_9GAMM|nr:carboxymuconolactone decarboxylase family protein [Alkalimonas sp. MEB004]MEE2023466.1 carboxymuconolactone decarboxylase family protein [Alkalimonas sp. MEB004]
MSASASRLSTAQLYQLQPQLMKSLLALGEAAAQALEAPLVHLVKLRVSQLNGCAFCMQLHAAEARKEGEAQLRLDLLAAWRETELFSMREQAALNWAESLTLLADAKEVSEAVYQQANQQFSAEELASLTALTIEINGWNRIAISFYARIPPR